MGGGPTQIVPQEITQVINQACQGLAGEIQRSLDFYLATSGEQEISRIYISGGTAYLAPLVQAVERRARVPVQIFDPMANLEVDTKYVNEAQVRAIAAQMVVALGLSLRCDKERRQWSA
jgi:type IV pilus assembly protein PilM